MVLKTLRNNLGIIVLFFVLMLDLITTYIGVHVLGVCYEASLSPIVRYIMVYNPLMYIGYSLVICGICYALDKAKVKLSISTVLTLAVSLAVVNNVIQILMGI